MLLLSEGAAYSFRDDENKTAQDYAIENGWNWNEMLAQANINYFDQLVTCVNVANTLPKKKKVIKPSTRKRKRDEMEEEEEEQNENKEIPFLEDFMLEVINSDLMMPKFVFPFLSFNPGNIHESGQGRTEFPIQEENSEEEEEKRGRRG